MDRTSTKDLGFKALSDLLSPELEKLINQNEGFVDGHIANNGQAELNWDHEAPPVKSTDMFFGTRKAELVTCLTDCVTIVLLAAGIPKWRGIGEEIVANIPPEVLPCLDMKVQALERAATRSDKVKAVFTIFAGVYGITGIRQILGVIKHYLSWYKWVLLKVNITTKLIAWVASDKITSSAMVAIYWAIDAKEAAEVIKCGAFTKSQ